jgi:hypothetical protein
MDKIAAYGMLLNGHPLWETEYDLIKSASADEIEIYDIMCKTADSGSEEEILELLLLAEESGLDKEAGLMARGMAALGGALGRAGGRLGSRTLTQLGARASSRAVGMASQAAGRAQGDLLRAGVRGGGGLRAMQTQDAANMVRNQALDQTYGLARQAQGMPGLRNTIAQRMDSGAAALGNRIARVRHGLDRGAARLGDEIAATRGRMRAAVNTGRRNLAARIAPPEMV